MKTLAIIPARFDSSRLPGKPLKLIGGKPMIQRVYEQVTSVDSIHKAIVATDDTRIFDVVKSFGGEVEMTSKSHQTGTDRCIEVLEKYKEENFDIVLNVQGDEPFIQKSQLYSLMDLLAQPHVEIASLKKEITEEEELFNPNAVKVVTNSVGKALYFSRHAIPFVRGEEKQHWLEKVNFYKHLGVYGFKSDVLLGIKKLEVGKLEVIESLEQLRWLENGLELYLAVTQFQSPAVDTEEDLETVENFLKKHPEFL